MPIGLAWGISSRLTGLEKYQKPLSLKDLRGFFLTLD